MLLSVVIRIIALLIMGCLVEVVVVVGN